MPRTDWRWGAIVLLTIACNQPAVKPLRKAAAPEPQTSATVVTIRTTFQPENKSTTSTIVIGEDAARATDEIGTWRLFDFKQNRVAFVDDFAKTYRYETLQALMQRRSVAAEQPIGEKVPHAQYAETTVRRPVLGVEATQTIVKLGGYQRELWFGTHPLIPDQLFALMLASRTPTADAAMAKKVDEALLAARGFPLLEHAELPFAKTKIVIDRDVVSVARRNVPVAVLHIPRDYRQLKPLPPAVVVRPRPVIEAPAPVPVTTTTPPTTTETTTAPPLPPTATVPPTTTATATDTTATTTSTTSTTTTTAPKQEAAAEKKPVVKKAAVKKPAAKKAVVKKAVAKKPPVTKAKPPATKKKTATKATTKAPATKKKAPVAKPKAKAPASRPPAFSSRPHDQRTPGAGSQSFATGRRAL